MSLLKPDIPYGRPAFALSDDEIATVLDLVCRGADLAKSSVRPGMLEVSTTQVVRKAMKRVKRALGFTNLQIIGELELDDMTNIDPGILGRIDIILQFVHQFGDEDAYVAVECKRVRAGDNSLNAGYVTDGVERFVTGKYAAGHQWGFMLGYVLALPVKSIIDYIDARVRRTYGDDAALVETTSHPHSLAVLESNLLQSAHHPIRMKHVLVDMLIAAPASAA